MAETKTTRTRKAKAVETTASAPVADAVPTQTVSSKPTLTLDTMVKCVSSIPVGNLIYVSKRMQGRELEWHEFGDEQYIELAELQAMRNSYPSFFSRNWILIDDDAVLQFLNASKYYTCIKSIDDYDRIMHMSASEIAECVPTLSKDLKCSLAAYAYNKYVSGELDSVSILKALESATKMKIIDN